MLSQCLVKDSTLARPERNLACTVALTTWKGEPPHVVKIGWVVDKDIKAGLKNSREDNIDACVRSLSCQWSRTAAFTSLLKENLDGGFSRKVIGCGKLYSRNIPCTCRNQDLEEALAEE